MFKQVFVVVIVAYVMYQVITLYEALEFSRHVYNHKPGPCHYVKGTEMGSEDMEELPNGLLLITSGVRFNMFDMSSPAYQGRIGSIKLFDFKQPEKATTVKIEHGDGFDLKTFTPHGISSWQDAKTGVVYVFVINHLPDAKEVVERFQFDDKRQVLKHLETFPPTDDVYYLNDILAVGPRSFYYSNFQYFVQQPYALLEGLFRAHWGGVGYYDGESGTTKLVHKNMFMANGVNKSPDGKLIYVPNVGEKEILVFRRNNDNSLEIVQTFQVHTGADNLYVSPDGKSIWTGAHPVTWQAVQHLKDGTSIAPSQVLRLTLDNDGLINSMQEVLSDDGELLSGSSIAVYRDGYMIVGTVSKQALFCQVKHL